jgi:hypothetical protein
MVFDCNALDSPKPSEIQDCTPPAPAATTSEPAPAAAEQSAPDQQTQPSAQIEPTAAPAPQKPACTMDLWTCGPWPDKCDIFGNLSRTCKIQTDCAAVETPAPATKKRCEKLQCEKKTLNERVLCRLNLAPAGIAREYEIQYLPEECRAKKNTDERERCVKTYKALQPCFDAANPGLRFGCAAKIFALGQSVSAEMQKCNALAGDEKINCKSGVREKAYAMIKFRLYDLSERAEALKLRGDLTAEQTADFVALVETKKQEFDEAKADADRRAIINDVREAWKELLKLIQK